jgi:integrase
MLEACNTAKVSYPLRLQCIIAMCWLFGKRISEICALKICDVYLKNGYLYVSFLVKKQKDPKPFIKSVTVKHFCVPYVAKYVVERVNEAKTLNEMGSYHDVVNQYLFPSWAKARTVTVKHYFVKDARGKLKKLNSKDRAQATEVRTYTYQTQAGHLTPHRARQELREVSNCWFHLFRSSLASAFIEKPRINIYDLMAFFDWSKADTALRYIRHSSKTSSKFARRTE